MKLQILFYVTYEHPQRISERGLIATKHISTSRIIIDATSLAYKRNTNLHDSISQYAPTLLKSYPIAFRLPLTSHRATHETVKCPPLYLQNSESKKKHRKYPPRGLPQNRFYDTLTVNQMLIRNSFQIKIFKYFFFF